MPHFSRMSASGNLMNTDSNDCLSEFYPGVSAELHAGLLTALLLTAMLDWQLPGQTGEGQVREVTVRWRTWRSEHMVGQASTLSRWLACRTSPQRSCRMRECGRRIWASPATHAISSSMASTWFASHLQWHTQLTHLNRSLLIYRLTYRLTDRLTY